MISALPAFPVSEVQPERIEYARKFHAGEITLDQYRSLCAALDKNWDLFDLLESRI